MKLMLQIKVNAIHVSSSVYDAIKESGQNIKPFTDAITGDIDRNMLMLGKYPVLRDDSVNDIDVSFEQSVVEVKDE